MPTKPFNNLSRRLVRLESRFLPPFSPIGRYSDAEYDRVRGYLLLCHAEIESYLEEHSVGAAERSLQRWRQSKKVNLCLAALLLHHDQIETGGQNTMEAHLHAAVKKHVQSVRKTNHGIKEKDVFKMFVPIGIDKSEFSTTLLAELDTLGSARGSVAHSSAKGVMAPPDPKTTRDQIHRVIEELEDFDELARTLPSR